MSDKNKEQYSLNEVISPIFGYEYKNKVVNKNPETKVNDKKSEETSEVISVLGPQKITSHSKKLLDDSTNERLDDEVIACDDELISEFNIIISDDNEWENDLITINDEEFNDSTIDSIIDDIFK